MQCTILQHYRNSNLKKTKVKENIYLQIEKLYRTCINYTDVKMIFTMHILCLEKKTFKKGA